MQISEDYFREAQQHRPVFPRVVSPPGERPFWVRLCTYQSDESLQLEALRDALGLLE